MNTKEYGFNEATVQVIKEDGEKIAIFDVSPTIECRWIGLSNKSWKILTVFPSTREMLKFLAKEQINGATIPNEDRWLDEQAGMDGFDTWAEFVGYECIENEVEFPTYHDAQGREHAEF